jgi:hypothetical protein
MLENELLRKIRQEDNCEVIRGTAGKSMASARGISIGTVNRFSK